jgi:hypothetical protein
MVTYYHSETRFGWTIVLRGFCELLVWQVRLFWAFVSVHYSVLLFLELGPFLHVKLQSNPDPAEVVYLPP